MTPEDAVAHEYIGSLCQSAGRYAEAEESFRKAAELAPQVPAYHYSVGVSLVNQTKPEEAMVAFQKAIEVSPNTAVGAYNAIAFLLRRKGDLVGSSANFRKVYEIEPDTARGLRNLAQAQLDESSYEDAAETLARALEIEPADVDTQRLLANVLQQLGRFSESRTCFERVIEAAPRVIGPYVAIAKHNTMTEEDRPLINKMIGLARSDAIGLSDRGMVHFALGKAFEDLGDYKEAMTHYDEANGILQHARRARVKENEDFRDADVARTIRSFTKDAFAENASVGLESETPLVLVGMYRSGLTLLERILSSHPEVGTAGDFEFWTEPSRDVFIGPKRSVAPGRVASLGREYDRLLQEAAPDKRYVLDRTAYAYRVLGQIHMALPKAKIVHIKRHPLDTCLSIYLTQNGNVPYAGDRGRIVIAYEEYEKLMEHWRSVLPAERFIEVEYEQLVQAPEPTVRALLEFLGLEWDEACLHPERQSIVDRVAGFWQLRQPISARSVGRWKHFEPWIGEFAALADAPGLRS